ncbi:phosphate signaling complex PhoU family protein [Hyperthermus butylicus]|uniref:Phosphate regulatory protein n=1 Tax=Hyperthermus butylicus (strain DSM 5456 / JCM 9403 / PLM1-5) TaxID=415426 RepID=A2BLI4_HYPBU|nr:phosphate uptake regulator PhoU [Hyperthermus butylicus]ABM80845.1 putative phosphate regulatory protein [Hyperthermus butylicus DSM 5456]
MGQLTQFLGEIRRVLDRLYGEAAAGLREAFNIACGGGGSAESVGEHSRIALGLRSEVTDMATIAIARFQPVARDLRRLTSYLEAAYDLFRISRYAFEIARLYQLVPRECRRCSESIRVVLGKAEEMLDMAYRALVEEDGGLAEKVSELDASVDEAYVEAVRRLGTVAHLSRCEVAEMLLLRHVERIADHAVYIAAEAYYIATGHRVYPQAPPKPRGSV